MNNMSKRDKSVIRRSVKREMTIIKNLYFNKTNSARSSTIINTNNEDQVIFKIQLLLRQLNQIVCHHLIQAIYYR